MNPRKSLKHAFGMVMHSKLRSWLTIIGIVIGVGAVIAIVSLGEGFQAQMNSQLSGLGGDILTLSAGASRGNRFLGGHDEGGQGGATIATKEKVELTRLDVQALRGIPEVALIDTNIRGNVDISFLGKSGTVSVTGVDQKVWGQITTKTVADGRLLDSADQNVVVIGGRLAAGYFDQPLGINKMFSIEGSSFRVVGILDDESNGIYMPIAMAYQVLPDKTIDVYDSVVIKINDENNLEASMAAIESKLMMVRHVTSRTKDFGLSSSKQQQATRSAMMSSMNTFLLAIAMVSLIVGAVGIANTMFTSVLEKTKEIGIMKAIGARNHDILMIFLFNAALIGLVGGILGVLFGTLLSGLLPSLIGELPMLREGGYVSLRSIIMALSVSVGTGLVAGAVPAYKASKLRPVDALRYE